MFRSEGGDWASVRCVSCGDCFEIRERPRQGWRLHRCADCAAAIHSRQRQCADCAAAIHSRQTAAPALAGGEVVNLRAPVDASGQRCALH